MSNSEFGTLTLQLFLLIALAQLLGYWFTKLRQPKVIGEILAGIVIGPSILGHFAPGMASKIFPQLGNTHSTPHDQVLMFLYNLGLLLLMFASGAETRGLFGVDLLHDTTAFGPATTDDHIAVCVEERVRLVVFHFNVPPKTWVDRLHTSGCRVWMQAASVEQAVEAARVGVDAIVAQGRQAGGHNKSVVRTLPLLHRIIRAVKPLMVLASGGIATGADVADALVNGADGVWVGTRMVASVEAYAHADYKRRITESHGLSTAVTTAFGPEYPNVPYRVLRTDLVRRVAGHEDDIPPPQPGDPPIGQTVLFPFTLRVPYTMPPFSATVPTPDTSGEFDLMGFPAGEDSVHKIKSIKSAAEIIREMMRDARDILQGGL